MIFIRNCYKLKVSWSGIRKFMMMLISRDWHLLLRGMGWLRIWRKFVSKWRSSKLGIWRIWRRGRKGIFLIVGKNSSWRCIESFYRSLLRNVWRNKRCLWMNERKMISVLIELCLLIRIMRCWGIRMILLMRTCLGCIR